MSINNYLVLLETRTYSVVITLLCPNRNQYNFIVKLQAV